MSALHLGRDGDFRSKLLMEMLWLFIRFTQLFALPLAPIWTITLRVGDAFHPIGSVDPIPLPGLRHIDWESDLGV